MTNFDAARGLPLKDTARRKRPTPRKTCCPAPHQSSDYASLSGNSTAVPEELLAYSEEQLKAALKALAANKEDAAQVQEQPEAIQISLPKTQVGGSALSADQKELAETIATSLGQKVESSDVAVTSFETKHLNLANWGFRENGPSFGGGFAEGAEMTLRAADGQEYTFRGESAEYGKIGLKTDHQGTWKKDDRGIWMPDQVDQPEPFEPEEESFLPPGVR